jgi:Flp pilus assembly pilin Flp
VFRTIRQFFRRNDGQDLAEYCLLVAFIGLVALGIVIKASGGIQGIWSAANTTIASAPGSSTSGSPSGSADSGADSGSRNH